VIQQAANSPTGEMLAVPDNTQEHKYWILINGANWNRKIKNYCYGISDWYLEVKGTDTLEIVDIHP
jgi:hypothetical protein